MLILLLAACLIDEDLYRQRLAWLSDSDGDGFRPADGDCKDTDASIHPDAAETCNGLDDDCDGETDEDAIDAVLIYPDGDSDGAGADGQGELSCVLRAGYVQVDGDCDDTEPLVYAGAQEICDDGLDEDCDGTANDCSLTGELRVDEDADATWSLDAPLYFLSNVNDMRGSSLGYSEEFGPSLVVGVSDSLANGSDDYEGGVLSLGLRSQSGSLLDHSAWLAPLEGDGWGYFGQGARVVDGVDGFGFSGIIAGELGGVFAADGPFEADGRSRMLVFDGLPGTNEAAVSDADAIVEWSGVMQVVDADDLDGDGRAEAVVCDSDSNQLGILPGPLTEVRVDEGWTATVASSSGSLCTIDTVSAGWIVPDAFGDGQSALLGMLRQDDGDPLSVGLLFALRGVDGAIQVEDADALWSIEDNGVHTGIGPAVPDFAHDLDGDGYDDMVIASYTDSSTYTLSGSVALYLGPLQEAGPIPAPSPDATVEGTADLDIVGFSTAIGDFDGSGTPTIAIGWDDETLAVSAGGVALWHAPFEGSLTIDDLPDRIHGAQQGEFASVARAYDVDEDSIDDLIILAPGAGPDAYGGVYLFYGGGL